MAPLRPYFDTELLAYLGYAIEEEETGIRAHGGDPIALPSRWLSVLRLVQQGVLAEFESRFERLLEPLLLTVRFEQPEIRRAVFERFVAITPAIDLPYMRQLATNMAGGVLEKAATTSGSDTSVDPALIETMISFQNDCIEGCLSEDYVNQKVAEFEAQAASEGRELLVRRRHPLIQAQIDDLEEERKRKELLPLSSDNSSNTGDADLLGESILGRTEGPDSGN